MQVVLGSWKEIANFLGKGVRTVQRWERYSGLPVHRPSGSSKGVVLAFPPELEQWARRQDAPVHNRRVNVHKTTALSEELVTRSRLLHESTVRLLDKAQRFKELQLRQRNGAVSEAVPPPLAARRTVA